MTKILREPLLHFLLLGALLFAVYGFLDRDREADAHDIVVTAGQIEHLLTTFSRTWQRPPTEQEAEGLIDQYVREEIYSREAIKLGLDRNDTVIRRRLQQKMEFVSEDLAATQEPTEADLAAYLAAHRDDFREQDRITFRQVFLSGDRRGQRLQSDATALLSELRARGPEADVEGLGDPTLLPAELVGERLRVVGDTFGGELAEGVAAAPIGEWLGPLRSSFGLHLVLVQERQPGGLPELAEIRDAVRREWENARRLEASRRFYDDLRSRYQITVEWPQAQSGERAAAR